MSSPEDPSRVDGFDFFNNAQLPEEAEEYFQNVGMHLANNPAMAYCLHSIRAAMGVVNVCNDFLDQAVAEDVISADARQLLLESGKLAGRTLREPQQLVELLPEIQKFFETLASSGFNSLSND